MNLHETATQSDIAVLIQKQATHELEWPLTAERGPAAEQIALLEEVMIEEVSIDGMCGVY